jgi:DNA-binding LytR/AlgR family response regulator
MRVLVIEDELLAAERLFYLLKKSDPELQTVGHCTSIQSTVLFLENNPAPDLIFMDIQLADGLSMEIFERVKIETPVIFCTAYDEYALDAFNYPSIDYLVKPVSEARLAQSLDKARNFKELFGNKQADQGSDLKAGSYRTRFLLKTGPKMIVKETSEVAFFYADGKTVYLVSKSGKKFVMDNSLDKLEEILNPRRFFRINRSVIVAIDAIMEFKSFTNGRLKALMKSGEKSIEAIVSRTRVPQLKEWAESY